MFTEAPRTFVGCEAAGEARSNVQAYRPTSTPNVIKENGTVPTNIDGLDGTATLLDSGSDDSLAAHAVVDALKTRGVHMETCKPVVQLALALWRSKRL
ncbi:hypothetical protein GQ600_3738 [Phytophthora cactorum]|nr:hypothetical protein GQ600_3738 [Phytophthora cactorum]